MSMPYEPSSQAKGKARADVAVDNETFSSAAFTPQRPRVAFPVTPPRRPQPPISTPAHSSTARAGSSSKPFSTNFSIPSSKRKSQARITSFFPNKKIRIETLPVPLSPAEKKAARLAKKEEEDDIKALIKDIEQEEREAKKAEDDAVKASRAADRQLKREAKAAAEQHRKQVAQCRANWRDWVARNSKPHATFKVAKGELWTLHRNVKQCRKEYGLSRMELDCLEHCSIENPLNEEYTDMRMYRLEDVERLAWRKEAILRGVEGSEEEAIAGGKRLFEEKKKAESVA